MPLFPEISFGKCYTLPRLQIPHRMTGSEARSAGTMVAVGANPRNRAALTCGIRLNRVAVTQTALRPIASSPSSPARLLHRQQQMQLRKTPIKLHRRT